MRRRGLSEGFPRRCVPGSASGFRRGGLTGEYVETILQIHGPSDEGVQGLTTLRLWEYYVEQMSYLMPARREVMNSAEGLSR